MYIQAYGILCLTSSVALFMLDYGPFSCRLFAFSVRCDDINLRVVVVENEAKKCRVVGDCEASAQNF